MDKNEIILAKFQFCTEIDESTLNEWFHTSDENLVDPKINGIRFREFLARNNMEDYFSLLDQYFSHQKTIKKSIEANLSNYYAGIKSVQKIRENDKALIEALHFLIRPDKKSLISFTIQKKQGKEIISNTNIISIISEQLIDILISEFKARELDIDSLSPEEAEEDITLGKHRAWINSWFEKHEIIDQESHKICDHGELIEEEEYINMTTGKKLLLQDIKSQLINDYAESHVTKREITSDFLEELIKRDYSSKGKAGAHYKNAQLHSMIKALSYLLRIDRILTNFENINDIEMIKLVPDDRQFIHDCLACWGLIKDKSKKSDSTTTPKKYINTLIGQVKQPIYPEFQRRMRIAKMIKLKSKISS